MALLFMDGFDHSGTDDAIHATKWGSIAAAASLSASTKLTGTASIQLNSSAVTAITKPYTTSGAATVGVAYHPASLPSSGGDLIQIREGTTVHVALAINSAGNLLVKRGSTTLATGAAVIAAASWTYLELKAVIHDSAGTYEVRINGSSQADLTATGQDTQNGGTATWDRIRLSGGDSSTNQFFDDLYLCDGSGSYNTTFLGVCKVETLLPSTGDGTHTDWTPSTGTDHGALVDENPPNTSDYNTGTTANQVDTYNFPSVSLTGTILGIQTNLYAMRTDAGARTICPVLRLDGTDYDGTAVTPSTSFGYLTELFERHPADDDAFVSGDINGGEFGGKIVT